MLSSIKKASFVALAISVTGCSTEEIKDAINEIIEENTPPVEEVVNLKQFNIESITATSPRQDGLDLDFTWEGVNEGLSGVSYRVCVEDDSKPDSCNELGLVTDSSEVTVTLDRIYPHTDTNFFVIASRGDDKVSTANVLYTYELFKSQGVRTENFNTSLVLGAASAPRVGGEHKAVYSIETVASSGDYSTEVSIKKTFELNGDRITVDLPNLTIANLRALNSEFSSSDGIKSVSRIYSDDLMYVTTIEDRRGSPRSSGSGVIHFNGSDYEWVSRTYGLFGDQDDLGYIFDTSDNASTKRVALSGKNVTELDSFSGKYSLVDLAIFANRSDYTKVDTEHLTLVNGDKYMFWRKSGVDEIQVVRLDASGATILNSVPTPPNTNSTVLSFDSVAQTLYAVTIAPSQSTPVGEYQLDLVVSAYKVTPSGLDLVSSYTNEELVDNIFPTPAGAVFVSEDGGHLIVNLNNSNNWSVPTFQGYGQSIVLDMDSGGKFTGDVDFIFSNLNPVPTDTVVKRSTAFLSRDMKSIQFHDGSAQYNIGKMTNVEL